MTRRDKIGFLGGGNMAEALIKGLVTDYCLIVSDIVDKRLTFLNKKYGVTVSHHNTEVVEKSDTVVVAVKPGHVDSVVREVAPALTSDHLIISIAAGVSSSHICRLIDKTIRGVIRVMPNTPALVGEGMTVIGSDSGAPEEALAFAEKIFSTVGKIVRLEEKYIDAATALSGSGPGFIFVVIEALVEGGVTIGLPRPLALQLTLQTVLGSAHLAVSTGKHPALLKEMVTSPGGTTISGIHVLENRGVRGALISAVEAAALKAEQIGKKV
jgi:pyrroline-5-carboxylate reductase